MKFIDLINEELYLTPEQKRQEKKAKTLFKALKNGVIKILHPLDAPGEDHEYIFFRYHIHDNVRYRWENHMGRQVITIVTNTIPGEGVYIETDNEWVIKRLKNKDSVISEHVKYMINSGVKRKFDKFGINIHVSPEGMNFVLKKSDQEPINENEDKDRLISKAQKINKAFRKGFFTMKLGDNRKVVETKFRYELPEKSYPSVFESGLTLFYRYDGDMKDKIGQKFPLKIWKIYGNGEEELLNDKMTNGDYASIQDNLDRSELSYIFNNVLNYVQRRYRDYGVFLNLFILRNDKFMELNESVINILKEFKGEDSSNLSEKQLKELSKGRKIHKALRKGKVNLEWNDKTYEITYDLTDVYFSWDVKGDCEVFEMDVNKINVIINDSKLYNTLVNHYDSELWNTFNKDSITNILYRHVGRRFKNFKIDVEMQYAKLNYVLDKPEPINEGVDNIVEGLKTEETPNLPEKNIKELKRGKTILKALKKGKIDIKWKDEKYDISYDITNVYFYWDEYSGNEIFHMEVTKMDIYVKDVKLYNALVKRTDDSLWDIWNKDSFRSILSRHIGRRFKNFKISTYMSDARLNYILDKPKPINEETDNKMDKKVKAVYTAFKTGIVKGKVNQNDKYRYVLPDDYTYNMYKQTLSGRDVVVVTPSEGIKVYYLQKNGEEILLPESSHPNTYEHVLNKVSNKTGQYNIYIKPTL